MDWVGIFCYSIDAFLADKLRSLWPQLTSNHFLWLSSCEVSCSHHTRRYNEHIWDLNKLWLPTCPSTPVGTKGSLVQPQHEIILLQMWRACHQHVSCPKGKLLQLVACSAQGCQAVQLWGCLCDLPSQGWS